MINVNLLKSKIPTASEGGGVEGLSFDLASESSDQGTKNKIIIKKIILMSLATIVVLFWESYSSDTLKSQSNSLRIQLEATTAALIKMKKTSGRATIIEKEAIKIEEKLKIIIELSKKRLKELKALDFLQSIIPDGTWLSNIDYNGKKVLFKGYAHSDSDLSKFVTKLEESTFFGEVLLIKSVKNSSKEGTVKSFELSSILGELN